MRLALGVIVALAVAVLLWHWRGNDAAPELPPAATPTEERAPPPSEVAPPTATAERAALETPAADVADNAFLYRLRVVQAGTNEPVAGATVRWLHAGWDRSELTDADNELVQKDYEAFLVRFGSAATTAANGRATIAGPRSGMDVLARSDELFGRGHLSSVRHTPGRSEPEPIAPDQEFTIEVRADRTLWVRTVDASGQPVAGVEVALISGRVRWVLGPSDAGGLMRQRHAQELPRADAGKATLRALLFGGEGPETTVDLAAVPDEAIEVTLPPFGSLEVALLDPQGRPWQSPDAKETRVGIERSDAPRSGRLDNQPARSDPPVPRRQRPDRQAVADAADGLGGSAGTALSLRLARTRTSACGLLRRSTARQHKGRLRWLDRVLRDGSHRERQRDTGTHPAAARAARRLRRTFARDPKPQAGDAPAAFVRAALRHRADGQDPSRRHTIADSTASDRQAGRGRDPGADELPAEAGPRATAEAVPLSGDPRDHSGMSAVVHGVGHGHGHGRTRTRPHSP
jgi:hypothetical protein